MTTWPFATWPANDIIRADHALNVSLVNRRYSALAAALRPAPEFAVGDWAWVYNSASTIRQGVKANTDARVVEVKLARNWTGPYKILAVGSCSAAKISVCSCRTLQTLRQPPRQWGHGLAGLTSTPLQRLKVEQITGHQSVRGRGGVVAVLYKTHWAGFSEPSWDRGMDLHLSRSHTLRYWAGTPDPHHQTKRLHRRMRIGAAQRELSRNNGERFLAPGYACVPRADWIRRYHDTVLPKGAHTWYEGYDGLWWLGKISASATEDKVYLVRLMDAPGPIELSLPPACYTTVRNRIRLLVLARSHRQCVLSGNPT